MAGNLESSLKAVRWEAGRDMPNFKYLNGEGKWSAPPQVRIKRRFRRIPLIIPFLSINRGSPSIINSILITLLQMTLIVLIVSIFLLPITLIAGEKINSPEYAEEVKTDKQGYQHWRFGNVWYSNTPLDLENKSLSKTAIDTIYYDEIRMDPFSQPNDSNLVWYGSGDVDSNNVRDWNDHDLIQAGIQNDQADIDGDGIPGTSTDAELFARYLNGDTLLPQINWSWPIITKEQRKDWLKKMLAIDKTDTITYRVDFQCWGFSKQTMINFKGFGEVMQDTSFLEIIDPGRIYDFSNNGRFNIPVNDVALRDPNHAIVACLVGNNPLDFFDWHFIEPQNDSHVNIGDWSMSKNANVEIYNSCFYFSSYSHQLDASKSLCAHQYYAYFFDISCHNSFSFLLLRANKLLIPSWDQLIPCFLHRLPT